MKILEKALTSVLTLILSLLMLSSIASAGEFRVISDEDRSGAIGTKISFLKIWEAQDLIHFDKCKLLVDKSMLDKTGKISGKFLAGDMGTTCTPFVQGVYSIEDFQAAVSSYGNRNLGRNWGAAAGHATGIVGIGAATFMMSGVFLSSGVGLLLEPALLFVAGKATWDVGKQIFRVDLKHGQVSSNEMNQIQRQLSGSPYATAVFARKARVNAFASSLVAMLRDSNLTPFYEVP